ncbi:MAG TPA: hypothetical protein PLV25_06330, partial [Opitutales bacterium]|nr:hypothetical protein [Opitutales bacterium]
KWALLGVFTWGAVFAQAGTTNTTPPPPLAAPGVAVQTSATAPAQPVGLAARTTWRRLAGLLLLRDQHTAPAR